MHAEEREMIGIPMTWADLFKTAPAVVTENGARSGTGWGRWRLVDGELVADEELQVDRSEFGLAAQSGWPWPVEELPFPGAGEIKAGRAGGNSSSAL